VLLGYPSHSAYVAAEGCAKTSQAVHDMLNRLAPAAVRNARAEADDLQPLQTEPLEPGPMRDAPDRLHALEIGRIEEQMAQLR